MAEHIVQLSLSIDDNRIEEILERNAYKDIIDSIKNDMARQLPKKYRSHWGEHGIDWRSVAENVISEFVIEHKDEVIDAASKEVAASIKRSKRYREAVEESARLVVSE